MTALETVLRRMPTRTLETLMRRAKDPKGGLRPFFAHPRAMIALRGELARRNDRARVWMLAK